MSCVCSEIETSTRTEGERAPFLLYGITFLALTYNFHLICDGITNVFLRIVEERSEKDSEEGMNDEYPVKGHLRVMIGLRIRLKRSMNGKWCCERAIRTL